MDASKTILGGDADVSKLTVWRRKIHTVIYEADTVAGKLFDIALITAILLSTAAVMAESDPQIRAKWGLEIRVVEWVITILFSIEYVLRLVCTGNAWKYAKSFYGVVDLLATLPTYLSIFLPGTQYLIVIRILRILRVFRILKLALYLDEGRVVLDALRASRRKISIFMFTVLTLVTIIGAIMYLVESDSSGFTSIPASVYWAIVTLTTVGYGDIAPETPLGRFLASLVMILGYAIIAVPTGIVTAEMTRRGGRVTTKVCRECSTEIHDAEAKFCRMCGNKLHDTAADSQSE